MTNATNPTNAPVRTRFAPSPTGYLHVGGARTALFSWAFARHFGGSFILRIEDTDLERSTPEAVQAILDGMNWLDLQHDEGPFYQMQRMPRYREVLAQMLAAGTAYHCYSSPEEVEAMRERQRANGEKPRYDGTWRPEPGKTLAHIEFTQDGRYALASLWEDDGALIVYDAVTLKEVKRLPVGQGGANIGFTKDGRTAFIAVTGANAVAVVDMVRLDVVDQLKAGTQPTGLIVR